MSPKAHSIHQVFDKKIEEKFNAEAEEFWGILEEAFVKLREDAKNRNQRNSQGLIISKCDHCGCTELDDWGFCRQCGKSPHIIYKE